MICPPSPIFAKLSVVCWSIFVVKEEVLVPVTPPVQPYGSFVPSHFQDAFPETDAIRHHLLTEKITFLLKSVKVQSFKCNSLCLWQLFSSQDLGSEYCRGKIPWSSDFAPGSVSKSCGCCPLVSAEFNRKKRLMFMYNTTLTCYTCCIFIFSTSSHTFLGIGTIQNYL